MDYSLGSNLIAGRHHDGNTETGKRGSRLEAEWINMISDELIGVIEEAELEPDYGDRTQLRNSVRRIAQNVTIPSFNTVFTAAGKAGASLLTQNINQIYVQGHHIEGHGGALYRRVNLEPNHNGKFQDSKGEWWEVNELIITPEMFGAIGDGLTDDSSAFQAALDFSPTIYLDRKIYRIANISPPPHARLLGAGRGKTILLQATSGCPLITVNSPDCELCDATLSGIETVPVNGAYAIVVAAGTPAFKAHRLDITSNDPSKGFSSGIRILENANEALIENIYIDRLQGDVSGTGYGIHCTVSRGHTIQRISAIASVGRGRHAIYLGGGVSTSTVRYITAKGFGYEAITIYSKSTGSISTSNVIEDVEVINSGLSPSGAGISISGMSRNCILRRAIVTDCNANGINIDAAPQDGLAAITHESCLVEDCNVTRVGGIGIDVRSTTATRLSNNRIKEASNSNTGALPAIRLVSLYPNNPCSRTVIEQNTVPPDSNHRSAFQINKTSPQPSEVDLISNSFGAGSFFTEEIPTTLPVMRGGKYRASASLIIPALAVDATNFANVTVIGARPGYQIEVGFDISLGDVTSFFECNVKDNLKIRFVNNGLSTSPEVKTVIWIATYPIS